MKAKHLARAPKCRCGAIFTLQTPDGQWYWCWHCDAHVTDCKAKGMGGYCACRFIQRSAA